MPRIRLGGELRRFATGPRLSAVSFATPLRVVGTLHVECRVDPTGPVPLRFGWPGALREVEEIVDRWLGQDYSYFRVRTRDGALTILRHDERSGSWQISVFDAGPAGSARGE